MEQNEIKELVAKAIEEHYRKMQATLIESVIGTVDHALKPYQCQMSGYIKSFLEDECRKGLLALQGEMMLGRNFGAINIKTFAEILKEKRGYYGCTEAAIEFAADEYAMMLYYSNPWRQGILTDITELGKAKKKDKIIMSLRAYSNSLIKYIFELDSSGKTQTPKDAEGINVNYELRGKALMAREVETALWKIIEDNA